MPRFLDLSISEALACGDVVVSEEAREVDQDPFTDTELKKWREWYLGDALLVGYLDYTPQGVAHLEADIKGLEKALKKIKQRAGL